MLESYIREKLEQKELLLMTHIVMGYPSFDEGLRLVEAMVEAGVDLMELQIPFSEPMADGPVILHANQLALKGGATVERCFEFAEKAAARFDIPFLFMTYYNILYKRGVRRFVEEMKRIGLKGAIVPDLPPEEANEYLAVMEEQGLEPIFIFTPSSSQERMERIAKSGRGMIYCVARKGVTGTDTAFSDELARYLGQCRAATKLPIGVGFGVKERAEVDFLRGKADIAVIGSQSIRIMQEQGVEGVAKFVRSLR